MFKNEHPSRWRERLREALRRDGRSHSAIARDAGICPETLSRILTREDSRPSLDVVVRIAHAAGESVGWVLGEQGYMLSYEQRELLRRAAATIRKAIGEA